MKYKDGLNQIIKDLRNSKLQFTEGSLHEKLDNICYYCAEGVLLKSAGAPKDEFLDYATLGDLDPDFKTMLKKRYGIDFEADYKSLIPCFKCIEEEKSSKCPYIEHCESFEELVTHLNDAHSDGHKETASLIAQVAKEYN